MKKTSLDLDFSIDLPDFDGLLDDLDFDLHLSDDLPLNRERTEKNPVEDC